MSQYIGRRIVPVHGGVWDKSKDYEELTIVLYEAGGDSYISRRPVPAGTVIGDKNYWMLYSLYSAQIAEAVKQMEETDAAVRAELKATEGRMETRVSGAESLTNSNKAELNNRMDGIDKRLDANVSASTDKDADYAAEVVDARVDSDGNQYGTVGSHLRAIENGEGILIGAVNGSRISFLDITPELDWTADTYIDRNGGGLLPFTQTKNIYFATEEYVPFPYAGCWIEVRSAMSVSESDKSGIAFYDSKKKFISGSGYNRETNNLAFHRIFCPEKTAYMRMTCRGEANIGGVGIWLDDYHVSEGLIVDHAVTQDKLAMESVGTANLQFHSVASENLMDNAVGVQHAVFMQIPLEPVWTPDLYIARANGDLRTYTPGTNIYFATEDYLPFPYGGAKCLVCASMSTAQNDVSGLAFYDRNKKFISGLKYNQLKNKELSYTDFVCPEGTEFIRFTMYMESLRDSAKFWFMDTVATSGRISDGAVTTEKLAENSVTKEKLEAEIRQRLEIGLNDAAGRNLSENPLEQIRSDSGLLSVFRHVGCIGDSLASGEAVYKKDDGTTGGRDLFEFSWGQYLARMTGNTYYNWSRGGLRCDTFLTSSMAAECFDGDHKCEAYIIGLGQNERNKSYPVGNAADINLEDYGKNAATYYGNYGKIIQKIKELQPKAKIFVLTDPLSAVEATGYNAAVREIAEMFDNVYLVDLYTYGSPLYSSGFLMKQKRGGHFNAVGYYICALIIATYIDWIIKKYPEEFREVEFIGTNDRYY